MTINKDNIVIKKKTTNRKDKDSNTISMKSRIFKMDRRIYNVIIAKSTITENESILQFEELKRENELKVKEYKEKHFNNSTVVNNTMNKSVDQIIIEKIIRHFKVKK